jgi:tRNA(fMet)-specific endonuclease VapC
VTLRYLLDTSTVSSPASKFPNREIVKRLHRFGHECAIAAPVWHELTFGWGRLPAGKRRDALDTYLRDVVQASFPILPYDEAAAAWHGLERARLEALGRPAPYADGQIAAIARVNALVLVTLNAADFAGFADLEVEDWSKRRTRARPE